MSIETMITYFLAIFLFSVTPGPGVFALISNSLNNNIKTSYAMSFGMTISDIIYLILAFYGLVALTQNYANVFEFIRIAGGIYLIYLGYKIWTSKIDMNSMNRDTKVKKSSYAISMMKGFLISASNPKVIIFYIAFLPTFVDLSVLNSSDLIIISVLTFFALMAGLMLISFSAYRARKIMKNENSVKLLNRTSGSIMSLAGVYLISKD